MSAEKKRERAVSHKHSNATSASLQFVLRHQALEAKSAIRGRCHQRILVLARTYVELPYTSAAVLSILKYCAFTLLGR